MEPLGSALCLDWPGTVGSTWAWTFNVWSCCVRLWDLISAGTALFSQLFSGSMAPLSLHPDFSCQKKLDTTPNSGAAYKTFCAWTTWVTTHKVVILSKHTHSQWERTPDAWRMFEFIKREHFNAALCQSNHVWRKSLSHQNAQQSGVPSTHRPENVQLYF